MLLDVRRVRTSSTAISLSAACVSVLFSEIQGDFVEIANTRGASVNNENTSWKNTSR